MSLRVRLTLMSTLVMALVFAVFSVIAFSLVSFMLYQPIDDVLELKSNAQIVYILYRQTPDLTKIENNDPLSNVYYTVYDAQGKVVKNEGTVLVNDGLVSQALEGKRSKNTVSLPDGRRVRVLLTPIFSGLSGQIVGALQVATPLDITDERLNELMVLLAGTSIVLLAVTGLGSYLLTQRALRAVDRVTGKVRQIEMSQDLTQRIPEPSTDDEIGHLIRTFNQLIARLQSAFETQRRFIADSSHELRTPLTVIRSNMYLLRRADDPAERAELIEITEAEVSRLNGMVNDLLYMAQMQAGLDLKPVLRPVELDSLLLEVFARARSLGALKDQKITLAHEDIAAAMGDRDQLQHLLLNLVDNAIKYTPEGGNIGLGLWNEGEWARIEVSDNGRGIAAESLPLIFERFFRTHEARQTERNGAGLGLAIVKSIAEAHEGRVEVFSEVGEGTTFRLWLPTRKQVPLLQAPEQPARPKTANAPTGA